MNNDRAFKLAVLCLIALFLATMMTFALDWQDAFSQSPTPTGCLGLGHNYCLTPMPTERDYLFYLPVLPSEDN